jgi:hypothetical protein
MTRSGSTASFFGRPFARPPSFPRWLVVKIRMPGSGRAPRLGPYRGSDLAPSAFASLGAEKMAARRTPAPATVSVPRTQCQNSCESRTVSQSRGGALGFHARIAALSGRLARPPTRTAAARQAAPRYQKRRCRPRPCRRAQRKAAIALPTAMSPTGVCEARRIACMRHVKSPPCASPTTTLVRRSVPTTTSAAPGTRASSFVLTRGFCGEGTGSEFAGNSRSVSARKFLWCFSASEPASLGKWWQDPESNRGHKDFQSSALPTELSCRPRRGEVKGGGFSTVNGIFSATVAWVLARLRRDRGTGENSSVEARRLQRASSVRLVSWS